MLLLSCGFVCCTPGEQALTLKILTIMHKFAIEIEPIMYAREGNVVVFAYDTSELEAFLHEGNTYGTAGYRIVSLDLHTHEITFGGFGTPEGPETAQQLYTIRHNPATDGPWKHPNEWLKAPVFTESVPSDPDYRLWYAHLEVHRN